MREKGNFYLERLLNHSKRMTEELYTVLGDGRARCEVCAHRCVIKKGKKGICGVRENRGKEIVLTTRGLVTSIQVDQIEKKPLYHYLPGSKSYSIGGVSCNFKCSFCQNHSISFASVDDYPLKSVTGEKIVREALKSGCRSIAWTYNEPVLYLEFTVETSKLARNNGLKSIYVTNGFFSPTSARIIGESIDAANIDIKAFRERFYRKVAGGHLEPVIRSCEYLKDRIHLELTYLIIPTMNDDMEEIREFSQWVVDALGKETPVHFSRFHPDHRITNLPSTPLDTLERAAEVAERCGVEYIYLGNVGDHRLNNTRCPNCGTTLIDRGGLWINKDVLKVEECPQCGHVINVKYD